MCEDYVETADREKDQRAQELLEFRVGLRLCWNENQNEKLE